MKNFINPELKRSTIILLVIEISLIVILNIILTLNYNIIKNQYIGSKAALVGTIAKDYPELTGKIVEASFNVPSNEEMSLGNKILNDYGYNNSLKVEFVNGMKESLDNSRNEISLILVVFGVGILALNYFQYSSVFMKIRNLTKVSQSIIEGNYRLDIYENNEGDFSKLASKFKDMRSIIQSQMYDLRKEKQFLVNILSDISHQLKTPLSSLIVFNDILSKKNISEENRDKFLLNSRNQLNRMEWLIKSLLKLAKVDARAIEFNMKKNNLNMTIEESLSIIENMAKENNVELEFSNSRDEVVLKYDNEWLSEAIINIVKNAIEHSPDGRVNINILENPVTTKIVIKDNGEGIGEEDLPNIFKRFYKGGKRDSVGIGLSLSKAIIDAHGGYIEVSSNIRRGTVFTIVLPSNIPLSS